MSTRMNQRKGKATLLSDSHGAALGNLTEKINVYNFSMGSDSYFDMETKLIYLIKNSNVNKILIIVDDHTLSTYREKLNNIDRSSYYKSINEASSFKEFQ